MWQAEIHRQGGTIPACQHDGHAREPIRCASSQHMVEAESQPTRRVCTSSTGRRMSHTIYWISSANAYGPRSAFSWQMRIQWLLPHSGDHTGIVSHQWKQERAKARICPHCLRRSLHTFRPFHTLFSMVTDRTFPSITSPQSALLLNDPQEDIGIAEGRWALGNHIGLARSPRAKSIDCRTGGGIARVRPNGIDV